MSLLMIVILSLIGLLVVLALMLLLTSKITAKVFKHRADGDVRYAFMLKEDFPQLVKKPVSIVNAKKTRLNGAVFYYPKRKHLGVIIFYHGLFSGYLNYLQLIDYFAQHDYIVVAFDFTASMSSGGKHIGGLAISEIDAMAIIRFALNHPELKDYPLYTVGHSWGAHTALTSLLLSEKIKKAVAFNPFNSDVDAAYSFSPFFKVLTPFIYLNNLFRFGYTATYKVTDALKYSEADKLIITSGKDRNVKEAYGYKKFKKINDKHLTLRYLKEATHFTYMGNDGAEHFTKEIAFPHRGPIDFTKIDYQKINTLNLSLLDEVIAFLKK
ncbi:MAG: lysophospholipase [Bacilli bacterium]|nr:lysophospholipase [Bacilli bacterium]